jgi:hypothetical protein
MELNGARRTKIGGNQGAISFKDCDTPGTIIISTFVL